MRFVVDGPDIPPKLRQAHDDGHVVFFCGAGVSMNPGLPDFQGLVRDLYSACSIDLGALEAKPSSGTGLDDKLEWLEHQVGRERVRAALEDRLTTDAAGDRLSTHRALLKLGRGRDNKIRLVTTNFDRCFDQALEGIAGTVPELDIAPKLPVPNPSRWSGLTYLHGRIDQSDRCVLTTADFGRAYLTERWASRFVQELFRNFVVVFVGYGLNDPVMRYLVSALAADRTAEKDGPVAYILTSDDGEGIEQWRHMGLEPLLYASESDHDVLHRSLEKWADRYEAGLEGTIQQVQSLGRLPPGGLSTEDLDQMEWALRRETGSVARRFAEMNPPAPVTWLPFLEERGLLSLSPTSSSHAALAGHGSWSPPPELHPVTLQLGRWVVGHLDHPDVLEWALHHNGRLHPQMRALVRERLREKPPEPSTYRQLWRLMSSEQLVPSPTNFWYPFELPKQLKSHPVDSLTAREFCDLFRPYLDMRPPFRMGEWGVEQEGLPDRDHVSAHAEIEVKVGIEGHEEYVLDKLKTWPDRDELLVASLQCLTSRLRDVFDLYAAIDNADDQFDLSYSWRPSITPHRQNRDFKGWTHLITLLHDSWLSLLGADPERARQAVETWKSQPYPIFRRLVLFAMAAPGAPYSSDEQINYLLADDGWWFWLSVVEREKYRLLAVLCPKADQRQAVRLCDIALAGPPRRMFKEDLEETDWNDLHSHAQWKMLSMMASFGLSLNEEGKRILADNVRWGRHGDDRDEFPFWMETGDAADWGRDVGPIPSSQELLDLSPSELYAEICRDDGRRNLDRRREKVVGNWGGSVRENPDKALDLLSHLVSKGAWDPDIWRITLENIGMSNVGADVAERLLTLLVSAARHLESETRAQARALRTISDSVPSDQEEGLLALWDQLVTLARAEQRNNGRDDVSTAINRPIGILTEVLLSRIFSRKPLAGDLLQAPYRRRITSLAMSETAPDRLARVIIASRLYPLFLLDPAWVREYLLPHFNWDDPEAVAHWDGYLWGPNIDPPLAEELHDSLLEGLQRLTGLDGKAGQLCDLFTVVAVEFEGVITYVEAKEALRRMNATDLQGVAFMLRRLMAEAGDHAATRWSHHIGPWITNVWPRDRDRLEHNSSVEQLAVAASHADTAFPEAVDTILPLMGPIAHPHYLLHRLNDVDLVGRHPDKSLRLIGSVVSSTDGFPDSELRAALNRIATVWPGATSDPNYQRLNDFLIDNGM